MFTAFQHQAELLHGQSHGCSGQARHRTCSPDMDRCRCAAAAEMECWMQKGSKMMHSSHLLQWRTRWAAVPATIAEYRWRTVYTDSLSTVYSPLAAVGGHEKIFLDCRKRGGNWLLARVAYRRNSRMLVACSHRTPWHLHHAPLPWCHALAVQQLDRKYRIFSKGAEIASLRI